MGGAQNGYEWFERETKNDQTIGRLYPKGRDVTGAELAVRHPRLYHVTEPGAWQSIKEKGLLSTASLLNLFEVKGLERTVLETKCRASTVALAHPRHGHVVINDQVPLREQALETCLDDGLTPVDWLRTLNARVFFWPTEESLKRLLNARLNRNRQREVIVVDTQSLAAAHAQRMELSPINSGATLRKAARRGLDTFTPLLRYDLHEWRKLRGRNDQIREITVQDHVLDIARHTLEVLQIAC